MAIIFMLGLEINLMSQSDGYFYSNKSKYFGDDNEYEVPLLPKQHGLDYNYYADTAPLESGCLLLMGMGLLYAKSRIKDTSKS